jgi:hypothetical protein
MTMSTIYALIRDSVVLAVAESIDPQTAIEQLKWVAGEVYACRISDSAAMEVREAVNGPSGAVTRGVPKTSALALLKRYSLSMSKVADIT